MNPMNEIVSSRKQRADFMLLISLLKAVSQKHPARIHFENRLFASDFDEDSDFQELFLELARMLAGREEVLTAGR